MSSSLVTVVIPVYKTEAYLKRCVSSVTAQSHRDLQILLIDDGSPDYCPQLCEQWAAADSRITVIHKENAGLGMARNTGIEHARGAYICFLDSDDYLAPGTIARALALAQRESADVTVFGFVNVDADGNEISRRIPKTEKAIYTDREVQDDFLPKLLAGDRETGLNMSVCWSLFAMDTVRKADWRFPSEREIISEDIYALLRLYPYVTRVAILPEALYHYRRNDSSLTHACRPDRFGQAKLFYKRSVELCRELGYCHAVIENCRAPFLALTIAAMKQSGKHLGQIIDDDLLQEVLRETKEKYWKKRIFYWAIRRKQYMLCRCLLVAQKGIKP